MAAKPSISSLLAVSLVASLAQAQPEKTVTVVLNGSQHMRLGQTITRVSVGAPDIADVAAFPPDELLVTGKRIGQTTATIWAKNDEVTVMAITVGYPVEQMTAILKQTFPDGKDLRVLNSGTAAVITGEVADAGDVEHAETLLKGFIGEGGTLQNLLSVPGDQQVQLEVSFAEVSRTALKQMGVNFWAKLPDYSGGLISPATSLERVSPEFPTTSGAQNLQFDATTGIPLLSPPTGGAFGVLLSTALTKNFPFSAALSVLASNGYARTLSEPTLVAMSGKEASFLAGGELPIPLAGALGNLTIDYKKFGVQLKFIPTVVKETIQLNLDTTVSDVDFSLGVRLATVTVPGLTERHSATTIRLRDGQSFVIAGLLSDRVRSSVDKVPGLGDLPVLGALFRSTSYRREETELLVVVTAHLVRPQDERPNLPGADTTTDPSDLELFLLGTHESVGASLSTAKKRRAPQGPVGFQR